MGGKDIGNAIEQTSKALPKTVNELDGALSSVLGLFNNIVLYPIKKANLKMKYNLDKFQEDMEEKLKDIPKENIKEPSIRLTTSVLENLRYSYDDEEIRDMYENLLAGSMDSRKSNKSHISYSETIKNIDTLDATIFNSIFRNNQFPCAFIRFLTKNRERYYTHVMPYVFAPELNELENPFSVSSSLVNLDRLGLIKIEKNQFILNTDYSLMKNDSFYKEQLNILKKKCGDVKEEMDKGFIHITDYGRNFGYICLGGKHAS